MVAFKAFTARYAVELYIGSTENRQSVRERLRVRKQPPDATVSFLI